MVRGHGGGNLAADGLLWCYVAHGRKHGLKQLRGSGGIGSRKGKRFQGRELPWSLISTGLVVRGVGILTRRTGPQQQVILHPIRNCLPWGATVDS